MILFLYLSIFNFILAPLLVYAAAPVIQISSGRIKGEDKESRDDKKFYAYRGIPFASAKRFELPQPPKNWSDVRDCEEYGKMCIQYSTFEKKVVGSEDCLLINVFTPETSDGLSKKLLPVLVFIHGTFMDGTAEIYRPHYFMDTQVVIVTFSWRQNVFGFLSSGDEVVRGNIGLHDQIAALKWIQTEIRRFSGDKHRVTIFGQGDGAASVQILLLSPIAKGLYRKAITQSGSALKLNVIQKNPKQAAQRIARLMDCDKVLNKTNANVTGNFNGHCHFDYENSTMILECLKLVDAKKLAEVQHEAFKLIRDPLSFFGPVIEVPSKDSVLSEHPYSIILSGRQNRVPWMTGLNSEEGLVKTGVILNDKALVDDIDSKWGEKMSAKLLQYDPSRIDITQKIQNFYLRDQQQAGETSSISTTTTPYPSTNTSSTLYPSLPSSSSIDQNSTAAISQEFFNIHSEEQFKAFTNMFTDRFYAVGMFDAVQLQAKFSPVYMYLNSYEGQYSLLDVYTGKTKEPTPTVKKVTNWFKKNVLGRAPQAPKHLGVCSGNELLLLFKYPDLKIKENARDYEISKRLVQLWVQFATDETKMVFNNMPWLPVNTLNNNNTNSQQQSMQVMKFGSSEQDSSFGALNDTFITRMKFWSTLNYLAPFDQ